MRTILLVNLYSYTQFLSEFCTCIPYCISDYAELQIVELDRTTLDSNLGSATGLPYIPPDLSSRQVFLNLSCFRC
jgi:hypothetical protein